MDARMNEWSLGTWMGAWRAGCMDDKAGKGQLSEWLSE